MQHMYEPLIGHEMVETIEEGSDNTTSNQQENIRAKSGTQNNKDESMDGKQKFS